MNKTGVGAFKDWQIDDIKVAAERYNFPWELLAAVIARESRGDWSMTGGKDISVGSRWYLPYTGLDVRDLQDRGYQVEKLRHDHMAQVMALASRLSHVRDSMNFWQALAIKYWKDSSPTPLVDGWPYSQYDTSAGYGWDIWRMMKMFGFGKGEGPDMAVEGAASGPSREGV